jgi:hypothetical protein
MHIAYYIRSLKQKGTSTRICYYLVHHYSQYHTFKHTKHNILYIYNSSKNNYNKFRNKNFLYIHNQKQCLRLIHNTELVK